jgi:heterodisulfide reductase subunit A-like polyferredoxin
VLLAPVSHVADQYYLGASGIAATKNLLEQGFDVTGYEKNGYIGGIWQYSTDASQTSVLKGKCDTTLKAEIVQH